MYDGLLPSRRLCLHFTLVLQFVRLFLRIIQKLLERFSQNALERRRWHRIRVALGLPLGLRSVLGLGGDRSFAGLYVTWLGLIFDKGIY